MCRDSRRVTYQQLPFRILEDSDLYAGRSVSGLKPDPSRCARAPVYCRGNARPPELAPPHIGWWRRTRYQPRNLVGVGESNDHLIYKLIIANRSRNAGQLEIGRNRRNELLAVEDAKCSLTVTACHCRYVIHIRIVDHSCKRRFQIVRRKLVLCVRVPEVTKVRSVHPVFSSRRIVSQSPATVGIAPG